MVEAAPIAPAAERQPVPASPLAAPIRTDSVYVIVTRESATRAAVRVAHDLSRRMGSSLTVVDFRSVRYPLTPDRSVGESPVQGDEFAAWLKQHNIAARVRVFVCGSPRTAVETAFRPRSLVVLGGRRRWWLTRAGRLRRVLEAAGHFVLFVDEAAHAS